MLATIVVLGLGAAIAVAFIGLSNRHAKARAATTGSVDPQGRLGTFDVYYRDLVRDHRDLVQPLTFTYSASDGAPRTASVLLPAWYSRSTHPALPLVITPHGRGLTGRENLRFWGGLPAFGPFIVVSPDGQGRKLTRYSWGWSGQIDDLARMPTLLTDKLPWVRIDRRRIYAVGTSMGGQETLLLVARHPHLLAGAAALDSATDMAARYEEFPLLHGGARLQRLAREEIGGTPTSAPRAYTLRSPIAWVAAIARSGVPLHIWWSRRDRIVVDQYDESGRLYRLLKKRRPVAAVTQYAGDWAHSKEFHAGARLPLALVELRLIRLRETIPDPDTIDRTPAR